MFVPGLLVKSRPVLLHLAGLVDIQGAVLCLASWITVLLVSVLTFLRLQGDTRSCTLRR